MMSTSVNCQQLILLVQLFMSQYEFIIHINIVNSDCCFTLYTYVTFKRLILFHVFLSCQAVTHKQYRYHDLFPLLGTKKQFT